MSNFIIGLGVSILIGIMMGVKMGIVEEGIFVVVNIDPLIFIPGSYSLIFFTLSLIN